jgi:hypothetical protein
MRPGDPLDTSTGVEISRRVVQVAGRRVSYLSASG